MLYPDILLEGNIDTPLPFLSFSELADSDNARPVLGPKPVALLKVAEASLTCQQQPPYPLHH